MNKEVLQLIQDAKDQGQTTLDLSHSSLTELPESIGELVGLTNLNLSNNSLRELPSFIGSLQSLISLNLSNNFFKELPETIGELRDLTSLDISDNRISKLPESIGKLHILVNFDLSNNNLREVPKFISRLQILESLNLLGTGFSRLPEFIGELRCLKNLNIASNNFNELPKIIEQLHNLTTLDLSYNNLDEFPTFVEKLCSLTSLNISNNRLKELPEFIGQLQTLTNLNLSYNRLSELPDSIKQLGSLTNLDLSGNFSPSILPKFIGQLRSLTSLNLSSNNLFELPVGVEQLYGLTSLNLSDNYFRNLPDFIGKLYGLRNLNVSNNNFKKLFESIGELHELTSLNISCNNLYELPNSIAQLYNLTRLDLSDNLFKELPEIIAKLYNLTSLKLSHMNLGKLSNSIGQLYNLKSLDLSNNHLRNLPESIGGLYNLISLNLSGNNLGKFPESIKQLHSLKSLNLSGNNLIEIPEVVGQLHCLTDIDLANNQLSELSKSIGQLYNLKYLRIQHNQLVNPPQDIAEQGLESINRWFEQKNTYDTVPYYEAKVLFLGSPEVGKTSLRKKIEDIKYKLRKDEPRTVGVDIYHWQFDCEDFDNNKNVDAIAHIFDFAGQEIQYMAHTFFLSPNAFYILVWNHNINESEMAYWLDCIYAINDQTPEVLPIYNQFKDCQRTPDIRSQALQTIEHLPQITVDLGGSNTKILEGKIEELKEQIKSYIFSKNQEIIKPWKAIQHSLTNLSEPYISIEVYRSICEEHKLENKDYQDDLLGSLSRTGYVLYFENIHSAKIFLNPNWLIKALYTLFKPENNLIKDAYFSRQALMAAWSQEDKSIDRPQYTETEQDILFQLLEKERFNICYQPDIEKDQYLVPQYLIEKPIYFLWQQHKKNYDKTPVEYIHYAYQFLPLGFMGQLIVLLHDLIAKNNDILSHWKSGMVLSCQSDSAMALIEYRESLAYKKHIAIEILGPPSAHYLLKDRITVELNKLFSQNYRYYQYEVYIPCYACLGRDKPGGKFKFNDKNTRCSECGEINYRLDYSSKEVVKVVNVNVSGTGNIVNVAEYISDVTNTVNNNLGESKADEKVNLLIKQLNEEIANIADKIDSKETQKMGKNLEKLSEEVVSDEPDKEWYEVSLNGIKKAAEAVGEIAEPIIKTVSALGALLL